MNWITIIGLLAAVGTTVSFLPQVIKSWKTKQTKDVSVWMYSILIIGITLWLVYGFLIKDLPLIVANSVSFILTSSILILKMRYG